MSDILITVGGMLFFFATGLMVGAKNYARQLRMEIERGDKSLFVDGVWIMIDTKRGDN
ncbi:hypothetical protein ACSHUI_00385 [Bacillus subtilis]|uniref:hypothetical protein n=1 Tax=Bacillus subtilis TaxID=1423 RepID=UPI003CECD3C0